MFCEKCGSNNRNNAAVCSHCGEAMPTTSSSGGFGDILSYEDKFPSSASNSSVSSPSSENLSDEIKKLKQENSVLKYKIRTFFRLIIISLSLSVIALAISAIAFFSNSGSFGKEDPIKETAVTETQTNAVDKQAPLITSYKNKIYAFLPEQKNFCFGSRNYLYNYVISKEKENGK